MEKEQNEIEEHFYYYSMLQLDIVMELIEQGLTKEEINSALYGLFVTKGKPYVKGYKEFKKQLVRIVREINKKSTIKVLEQEQAKKNPNKKTLKEIKAYLKKLK